MSGGDVGVVAPASPAPGAGFTDGAGAVVAEVAGELEELEEEEPDARPARNTENAATKSAPTPAATRVDTETFRMPASRLVDLDGATANLRPRSSTIRSPATVRAAGKTKVRAVEETDV